MFPALERVYLDEAAGWYRAGLPEVLQKVCPDLAGVKLDSGSIRLAWVGA